MLASAFEINLKKKYVPCRRRRWSPPCRHRSAQVWNQTSCKVHWGKRWSDICRVGNKHAKQREHFEFGLFTSSGAGLRDSRHTSRGVLEAEMAVNPTISLKYMVTESKLSAGTCINNTKSPWKMETPDDMSIQLVPFHSIYRVYRVGELHCTSRVLLSLYYRTDAALHKMFGKSFCEQKGRQAKSAGRTTHRLGDAHTQARTGARGTQQRRGSCIAEVHINWSPSLQQWHKEALRTIYIQKRTCLLCLSWRTTALGNIWHNNRSQRFLSRFSSVVLDTNPLANV